MSTMNSVSLLSQQAGRLLFAEHPSKLATSLRSNNFYDALSLFVVLLTSSLFAFRKYTWDRPDPYLHIWYERPQVKDGQIFVGGQGKESRDISKKAIDEDANIIIFYGSQSGTGERFSYRLAREATRNFNQRVIVADLSDYDSATLATISNTILTIFILSSYGEGDPSDNASQFWDWLHSDDTNKPSQDGQKTLSDMRYCAFGLGSSNYNSYNRVVDVVSKRLDLLGATPLLPTGYADDAKGTTDEDFLAWKDILLAYFVSHLGCTEVAAIYEPTLKIAEDASLEPIDLHSGQPVHMAGDVGTQGCSETQSLPIKNARELFTEQATTARNKRNCMHLDLDLSEAPTVGYKTGDHIGVWPVNPDDEVTRLNRALGLSITQTSTPIIIKATTQGVKIPVPSPTTINVLFHNYLEICAPVSREVVKGLSQFASDEAVKARLESISRDKTVYTTFLATKHLTIGRLLEFAILDSPSATWNNLPLSFLLESLPKMQPRYYSISSSSIISPRTVSVTAVVDNTALAPPQPDVEPAVIPGLTTTYLLAQSTITPSPSVFAHIRKSSFKLPTLASTPIIMVAAGTGIAPFRAFVAERLRLHKIGKRVGEMILFFGCRHSEEDDLYSEEFETMRADLEGKLTIVKAFSRQEGFYVQDRMVECREDVVRLMVDERASFYVCGRASMARGVGERVEEVIGKVKDWDSTKCAEWTKGQKRVGKWQEDVWG